MSENTLQRSYAVDYSHIDNRGIARPSFLFDCMQDTATQHAASLHMDRTDLGVVWVLSRLKLQLARPLQPYETLTVDTEFVGTRGPSWFRTFRFSVENVPIGGANSMWVTLDPETRSILRPTTFPIARDFTPAPDAAPLTPLPKIRVEGAKPHHIHTVCYSDLDVNNHVNNVKVVDLIADALDLQNKSEFVSALQVNYTAETLFGEQLTLSTAQTEDGFYVDGTAGDVPHFEALAVLTPSP